MKVILMQHGEALPEEVDAERSLSEKGRGQVRKAADILKHMPEYPERILHSGKKRALQTAEIVSFALGGIRMEARDCLNPKDSPDRIHREISASEASLMIVGHMPFLGRLASLFLGSAEDVEMVDIAQASPLVLTRVGRRYILDMYIKTEYVK